MRPHLHRRRVPYTLMEMLVVIALLVALMNLADKLFRGTWDFCRDAVRQTERRQQLLLVRSAWRDVVHRGPVTQLQVTGNATDLSGKRAPETSGKLVLTMGAYTRRATLPPGTDATVSVEPCAAGGGNAAVLTLTWAAGPFAGKRTEAVRLVACAPRGDAQEAAR